jgi:hypothetical protein
MVTDKNTEVSPRVLWGMVRAMVKVDIRSMVFANDPNIAPRVDS